MVMLDTNIILRYLLNDNEEMADEAENVIKQNSAQVTIEVIAEVIYVLKGVYSAGREEIKTSLLDFIKEVHVDELEVLQLGIETYGEQNLDFIDCLLYAYHKVKGYKIKTFDKKLIRLIEKQV